MFFHIQSPFIAEIIPAISSLSNEKIVILNQGLPTYFALKKSFCEDK